MVNTSPCLSHRKMTTRLIVMSAATVVILAGCGSTSRTAVPLAKKPVLARAIARKGMALASTDAPAIEVLGTGSGYGTLSWIAAPRDRDGVWAWDSSATDSRIWYADSAGARRSWSLGAGTGVRTSSAWPALAACGSDAWLGINNSLFEVDSVNGVSKTFEVPSGPPNPAVESHRPEGLRGASAVQAVACSGSTVAVARSDSTNAFLLDTNSGKWTLVPLPDDQDAVSTAVDTDGVAAFGLQDYEGKGPHTVILHGPGGNTETVTVNDSIRVAAVDGGFRVGAAGVPLTVSPKLTDANIWKSPGVINGPDVSPETPVAWTPTGSVLVATANGLDLHKADGTSLGDYSLGVGPCGDATDPYNPNSPFNPDPKATTAAPKTCTITAGAVAVDGVGNIYAVPAGGTEIVKFAASSATN